VAANGAGGGGGAGGAIVLEAPRVQLDAHAVVAATGGGGGSMSRDGYTPYFALPIADGCVFSTHAGAGGALGNASGLAGASQDCAGGGAAGWIRINAGSANPAIDSSAIVSPSTSSGAASIGAIAPR